MYAIERRFWARRQPRTDNELDVFSGVWPSVDALAPVMLPLCVGAAVVLTQELSAVASTGLPRVLAGARGRVVGFVPESDGANAASGDDKEAVASLPMLPVVRFDELVPVVRVVRRVRWRLCNGTKVLCQYEQFPLVLGWACYDGQVMIVFLFY